MKDLLPLVGGRSSCVNHQQSSSRVNQRDQRSGILIPPFNMRWSITKVDTSSTIVGGESITVLVLTFHTMTLAVMNRLPVMGVTAALTWPLVMRNGCMKIQGTNWL